MRNITKIDIILENCECFTVDAKHLGEFALSGISEKIKRIACNSIANMKIADEVAIEIFKDADEMEQKSFGSGPSTKLFDRLTEYNDITSFRIYYEGENKKKEEHEDIYIDWYGDSDNENESQISYISTQGHLYIVIAKDKNIDDFFDSSEIEDAQMMDYHRSIIAD